MLEGDLDGVRTVVVGSIIMFLFDSLHSDIYVWFDCFVYNINETKSHLILDSIFNFTKIIMNNGVHDSSS